MKLCNKCNQPMISSGSVCGRLSCAPSAAAKKMVNKHLARDYRGQNTRRVSGIELREADGAAVAPPSKSFYLWAVDARGAKILAVGMQLIEEIQRNTYRAPTATREWIGQLSNAGRGARVNYTLRTNALREYIARKNEEFTQQTIAEQLCEKVTREEVNA